MLAIFPLGLSPNRLASMKKIELFFSEKTTASICGHFG